MELTDALLEPYFKRLREVRDIVLSTSAGSRVTSRVVSCACCGEEIFFLSWGHHTKSKQIAQNPNVALCHSNIQLEGQAKILGNPLDPENKIDLEKYKERQPTMFEGFAKIPGMQLIKVTLSAITSWTKDDKSSYIDHIDLKKRDYQRIRPTEQYSW
jgi:hypothetical protein